MPKIVSAREIYAQPEPSDELTWAICGDIFTPKRECCGRCPHSEFDEEFQENVIRGCRAQAEEVARVAMAVLRKEGWRTPDDTAEEVERLEELMRATMGLLAAEDRGAALVQCIEEIEGLKKTIRAQGDMLRSCTTSGESGGGDSPDKGGQQTHGAPATDCQLSIKE